MNGPTTVWAQAKAELQRRGWFQGAYGAAGEVDTCAVCLLGALNAAATGDPDNEDWDGAEQTIERLTYEILERDPDVGDWDCPVGWWNDDGDRRVEDVYALLDELDAAERAS